uniref:Uncharacterized protein n=1 Tax=Dunaliella tertiolecta TaxID=3047 RepID=A0A7S3VKS3_DUNTE|mmetsp:Transcript_9799/g.26582  ORF Transcript_9799/g.26582 Transcript_9799/m.26582 type:complete len:167 (+) Transcript_9799:2723-3223(+)
MLHVASHFQAASAELFAVPAYANESPEEALGCSSSKAAAALLAIQPYDQKAIQVAAVKDNSAFLKERAEAAKEEMKLLIKAAKKEAKAIRKGAKALESIKGLAQFGDDDEDEDSAGVFQFKVFESSQESMSFLDDNADMDVDGMCAVSEELQEVIDKIVEIVDDAL